MQSLQEWFAATLSTHDLGGRDIQETRRRLVCGDGFSMSVQADDVKYCDPCVNGESHYSTVEIGYPSERVEALRPFSSNPDADNETIFGYVPWEIVEQIIADHGGIVEPVGADEGR